MPYARTYNRQYNFQDFQRDNPSRPLPADRVDAEFNEVKLSLDSTQANLKRIQRSDGALADGIVTQDSFSPGLSLGFTLRGAWSPDVNYVKGDGVSLESKFYIATANHLSTTANGPDKSATLWKVHADFTEATTEAKAAAAAAKLDADRATAAAQTAAGSVLDATALLLNYPIVRLGYIGDSNRHPLSSVTVCQGRSTAGWSVAQWRTLFPRVQALTEEIDRHAIQRHMDLNPQACTIDFPPTGHGIIDKTLESAPGCDVWLKGSGRGACGLKALGCTVYSHGKQGEETSGELKITDMRFTPIGQCYAVADIWFNGLQTPMCFVGRDCVSIGDDLNSWFDHAIVTRRYIRGWKLDNWAAYGRHFHVLETAAFYFPTVDAVTHMGNSTASADCMTVGYGAAVEYGFDGFTRNDIHCHEEGNHVNLQAYAGRSLFRARNLNRNFERSDNYTFSVFGWQGTGPCFDMIGLEMVKARDGLMVHDQLGGAGQAYPPSGAAYGYIFNCKDVKIADCTIYLVEASAGLNAFYVAGDITEGIEFTGNAITNLVNPVDRFLLIASDVPDSRVLEYGNQWYGGRPNFGYVDDQSGRQNSELRVKDVVRSFPGDWTKAQVSMHRDGTVTLRGHVTHTTDSNGDALLSFPLGLFRSPPLVNAASAARSKNNGLVLVDDSEISAGGFIAHCLGSNAAGHTARDIPTLVHATGR